MLVVDDVKDFHATWAARFNDGDIDGMLALADPAQLFVESPGVAVSGEQAKDALKQFLALKLPIATKVRHAYVMQDIALLIVDWSITGTGPDGRHVALSGTTTDVARKGHEGWKIVIDNPHGVS